MKFTQAVHITPLVTSFRRCTSRRVKSPGIHASIARIQKWVDACKICL